VAVLVNIGLGWVLIRAFGALGAGIADLVSLAVFGALEYLIVARRLFSPDVLGPIGRALAASGTMAIALYATRTYPLFLTLLAGAAVYALALIALRTFSAEERTMISELINDACHRLLPTELRPADGAGD
jgi:O-antigen/teichoic acid export membrane protein